MFSGHGQWKGESERGVRGVRDVGSVGGVGGIGGFCQSAVGHVHHRPGRLAGKFPCWEILRIPRMNPLGVLRAVSMLASLLFHHDSIRLMFATPSSFCCCCCCSVFQLLPRAGSFPIHWWKPATEYLKIPKNNCEINIRFESAPVQILNPKSKFKRRCNDLFILIRVYPFLLVYFRKLTWAIILIGFPFFGSVHTTECQTHTQWHTHTQTERSKICFFCLFFVFHCWRKAALKIPKSGMNPFKIQIQLFGVETFLPAAPFGSVLFIYFYFYYYYFFVVTFSFFLEGISDFNSVMGREESIVKCNRTGLNLTSFRVI